MNPLHIHTPYFESRALSAASGKKILLKMEALQPPGSFKIRGIGHACQEYARGGVSRFISSSGGNAGIAVANAGRQLGIPVVVVVPETTTERAKRTIEDEGADVIVHGASFDEANTLAVSMVGEHDAFLHPFDDPLIWTGHASMVDEMAATGKKPDAIVLSVGGGGLLSGVLEGLHRNDWSDVPIIAMETHGAESYNQSIKAGEQVTLPAITSIALCLGARRVCDESFAWSRKHDIRTSVVNDEAALQACLDFIDDHRIVTEPACGAALAAVYGNQAELEEFETIAVIVCGGVTVSVDELRSWHAERK